mgnify:CR=1 FL=1
MRAWSDGSVGKNFKPLDLVAKLLTPAVTPCGNLLRYHGHFAGNARWRKQVCPGTSLGNCERSTCVNASYRSNRQLWYDGVHYFY